MAAHFIPPVIQDNPHGWGPCSIPTEFKDIPYQPFSKGDRIGKVNVWLAIRVKKKLLALRLPQQPEQVRQLATHIQPTTYLPVNEDLVFLATEKYGASSFWGLSISFGQLKSKKKKFSLSIKAENKFSLLFVFMFVCKLNCSVLD